MQGVIIPPIHHVGSNPTGPLFIFDASHWMKLICLIGVIRNAVGLIDGGFVCVG